MALRAHATASARVTQPDPGDLGSDATARAVATAQALPGTPLGGWAAAHLLGVADMEGTTADGRLAPVLLCLGRSGRLRRRDGIELLRSPLVEGDVVLASGSICAVTAVTSLEPVPRARPAPFEAIPVTSPVRTAFDLARTSPGLWQAVEDVDCVFRGRDPRFLDLLAGYAAARPGWKGVDLARRASALASTRTRSRGESWLRMVWCVTAGLPAPLLNAAVRDGEGHLVAVPDLLDAGSGLVGEYDGAIHRTARQQHADAVRGELMASAGLTVVRASAVDRASPRALSRRLLAGRARAEASARRGRWVVDPQQVTHDAPQ